MLCFAMPYYTILVFRPPQRTEQMGGWRDTAESLLLEVLRSTKPYFFCMCQRLENGDIWPKIIRGGPNRRVSFQQFNLENWAKPLGALNFYRVF